MGEHMGGRGRATRLLSVALACAVIVGLHRPERVDAQEAASPSLELLPNGALYPLYRAGTAEPRVSGALLRDAEGRTYFDAALGGRFGILRYGAEEPRGPWVWQLDLQASVHPRLNLGHIRQSMESADFRFALPLTARRGRVALKLGYHHLSSHAGDEFLERNPRFVRINYVRDAMLSGITYQPTPDWVTYTEVAYAFYVAGGAEPWEVQLGAEYSPASAGCPGCGRPFVAVHGHLREEVGFGGSLNASAGWEWRSEGTDRYLRLGLEYRGGKSSQLEFFDRDERLFGLGIQIGP